MITPCGSPANSSAMRSAFNRPGVSRRKPVGAWACPSCGALWAQLSCAIVIPLSGWIATGKPSPLTETAISVDRSGVYWLDWGPLYLFPTVAARPVTSYESPPGKAGFRFYPFSSMSISLYLFDCSAKGR